MIKAIIFDFFGVIRTDPYDAWLKSNGFDRKGIFLEISRNNDAGLINDEQYYKLLCSYTGRTVVEEKKRFETTGMIDLEMLGLIGAMKPNYKIGLLSNAASNLIRDIFTLNDLGKYFDEIVISSEVGYIKPSKEIFNIMLDRLNIQTSEALFIDDNHRNIEGAEKIGIKSILFESTDQITRELQKINIRF